MPLPFSASPRSQRGLRRRLASPTASSTSAPPPHPHPQDDVAVLEASPRKTLSLARKGVTYSRDGAVVRCRFCEILRSGDAEFLYEDHDIAVFRPLAPVVASHVLVVPRCHIRNINKLRPEHAALLTRMRAVAEFVLFPDGTNGASVECKFAFHKPPFNSIDHVHMHAFRKSGNAFGCFGAIKYRTETWWCRSFDQVLDRLSTASTSTLSSSSSSSPLSSSSASNGKPGVSPRHDNIKDAWRVGDRRPQAIA